MDILYVTLITLGIALSGYLFGSLSWSVIITRYVFHIDIYKVGSGNAGGTNVGRALGLKWAVITIVLDIVKCIIPLWTWFFVLSFSPLGTYLSTHIGSFPLSFFYYLAGLAASIGHIFPIFFHFKGGKAVSCFAGFIFGTNWLLMAVGALIFFITLKWKKRVSLSSLSGTIACIGLALIIGVFDYFLPGFFSYFFWFFPSPHFDSSLCYAIFVTLYGLQVIFMHHANINRLMHDKEPETHFRKADEKPVSSYNKEK